MQKNKLLKYWFIVLFIVFFLLGVLVGKNLNNSNISSIEERNTDFSGKASLMIDYGNKVKTFNDISIKEEETVFEFLQSTLLKDKISFEFKDYGEEMGAFIQSINGVGRDPDGKRWWQYWVNNKYSNVGASMYKIKSGDIVEFKFTEGEQ